MKTTFVKLFAILVWILIFAYFVVSIGYSNSKQNEVKISDVNIVFTDSLEYDFVSAQQILDLLEVNKINTYGLLANELNMSDIEQVISSNPFVKDAQVYVDFNGKLTMKISQRHPVMRYKGPKGESFYITDDNFILPVQTNFSCYVPIITGELFLPFTEGFVGYFEKNIGESEKKDAKNLEFFCKLVNFVKFISESEFWDAQIVQINVIQRDHTVVSGFNSERLPTISLRENLVELVPRVGDCVILFGELDNFEQKLDKLSRLYHEAMPFEGWAHAKHINLMFENQIVVSNK
ncbi:MAG: hypothetical protein R3Y38_01830 [Rikenellaceae bacterium]